MFQFLVKYFLLFFSVSLYAQQWHFQSKLPAQNKDSKQVKVAHPPIFQPVSTQGKETVQLPSPSEWMLERVAKELAPFKQQGITSEMLDQIWKDRGLPGQKEYVRFIYKDGQLHSVVADIPSHEIIRFEAVKGAFERLNKQKPLPDFDLIVTLHDEYSVALPVFTFAKNKEALGCILMPDFEALLGYDHLTAAIFAANQQYPWHSKLRYAFWRGSSTGEDYNIDNWETKPRSKLVMHSINNPRDIDARFTSLVQMDDQTRNYLSALGFLGMPAAQSEHVRYKYQIDVDGNSCSYSRCYWQLLSNSVMLKQVSNNIQWYYNALRPYEHFIPLKADLSDLLQMLYWARSHDAECQEIAERATAFAKTELSKESTDVYLRLLLEEYAKIYHEPIQ